MKKTRTILFFLMLAASTLQAQVFSSEYYKQLFYQQLTETCVPNQRWEKSVTDITAGTPKQTKIFELNCQNGIKTFEGKSTKMKTKEFEHLFEYVYDNPRQAEFLHVLSSEGAGTKAFIQPGMEDKAPLQLQHFKLSDGKISQAIAKIKKSTPLYDLSIQIEVNFDDQGHYQTHTIRSKTSTLMGGDVEALIEVRLLK